MFCNKCGAQVDDNATVCPYCGEPMKQEVMESAPTAAPATTEGQPRNVLAILGLVFAFVVPLVGLILSILGKKKAVELGGSGENLAKWGLILSIVFMVLSVVTAVFFVVIYAVMIGALFASM